MACSSLRGGVPTFYDKYDGAWHAGLSLRNGNVGVGTAAPASRLDVGSNIENPQIQLSADGTLRARDKRFCIDHPLGPGGRLLVHACLEGPENAVYYRGEGRLEDGHGVVHLPVYFEALTRPAGRTVVVTPCCDEEEAISAPAASTVTDGRFRVRAVDDRNPRQRFFWEVEAVRGDGERLRVDIPGRRASRSSPAHPTGSALASPLPSG